MKKIVFGLGNPGKEYEQTRHNLGARVVYNWQSLAGADVASRVSVFVSKLYMNESGEALSKELKNTNIQPQQILVAHDDIELPLGEVELLLGGSAKGHNGVRSIHNALDTQDIHRLRLGVGRPPEGMDVKDFVLSNFNDEERSMLDLVQEKAKGLIEKFINPNIKS